MAQPTLKQRKTFALIRIFGGMVAALYLSFVVVSNVLAGVPFEGNLVFTGTGDGFFKAFDAKTGKELWKFQTGTGIISPPITWEQDGEQYIGVTTGYGGAVPLWGGDMAELTKPVAQGGSFWVFKLPSWDK